MAAASFVLADSDVPYGVRSITYIQSSRPNVSSYPVPNITAEAGNVTELSLITIATTQAWQGYYGNISGIITLEDSYGYVFYNWTTQEPKGEIYASLNDTISWATIRCFNYSIGASGQTFDEQDVEDWYGIGDDASDGIWETFNYTLDRNFFVGSRNITEVSTNVADCHATNTYRYDMMQNDDDFENVLLTDGDKLVYTAMIENNAFNNNTDMFGFDNREHDFQMLVAENGHNGYEDTPTTYYFWAEIE
ncbi:MAG: hypothetical protein V1866_00750 [archaeon]